MNNEDDLTFYRQMLRIRRVEEAIANRYGEQEMRCPVHLCIGQEATAVGVISTLAESDHVFSSHRAHGHYLAKGGDLTRMIAELYGRSSGCCEGRGGSMHLVDRKAGFMGSTPIVGGTVPIATGAAWASQFKQEDRVVCLFFGDGCFEEGVMHESMNFAALHQLPILFVCENNNYSVYTPLKERRSDKPIYKIAAAHGLNSSCHDGNNVQAVYDVSRNAVQQIRSGGGPQFLELITWRWREHCGPDFDDQLGYRAADENSAWIARCPVRMEADKLQLSNVNRQDIEDEIKIEVDLAFDAAINAVLPQAEDMYEHLYA